MTTSHAAPALSLRLFGIALAVASSLAVTPAQAQDRPPPATEEPAGNEASDAESIEEAIAADAAAAVDDAVEVPGGVDLDQVRRFVAVFRAVQQAYVDPVVEGRLMQAAVRGLLTDLDPHSSYLEQDAASALNEQASGAYDGLGLEVLQQPDRTLLVVAPIDDTPAARAGIRPGDVIVAVDGVAISADTVEAAVESMRGAPGTPIELTLLREGEEQPLVLTLVRETIRVTSVRVELLEPGYAYARVAMFQADSGTELKRKLAALAKPVAGAGTRPSGSAGRGKIETAARAPLRGLVLDLRSNPGGLLSAAVEIADLFLEQGVIVSTRGRLPAANAIFRAAPGDVLAGAPIVILTDAGTASAAEVVAGALRDQRRAVVMGGVSFGKGSVQTLLPLDNGDAIKITTARYYTPDGTSIQAAGIVPDIALDPGVVLASRDRPPTLREADLRGHLQNEAAGDDAPPAAVAPVLADTQPEEDDYAVREALNLLKGVAVFSRARAVADEDADGG